MSVFPTRQVLMPVALIFGLVLFGALPGSAAAGITERHVEAVAGELLHGLDNAHIADVPASSGYASPTLAIRVFPEEEPDALYGNLANDMLLAALQRQAGSRLRFVAKDTLEDLIETIDASGASDAERTAQVRDLRANLRPDILVTGTIRETERGRVLVYKAIAVETGVLFATATPLVLDEPAQTSVQIASATTGAANSSAYRATVHEAERLLDAMGYGPGPVDGVLTEETRSALRAYQADSALPVNGRMTWAVVENMRRDTR